MNHERFFGGTQVKPSKNSQSLPERVITLIEEARRKVASAANVALVYTYYEIGRMIVEDEQGGKERATYGDKTLAELSEKLTAKFGKGWSIANLKLMRQFFITYSNSLNTVYPIETPNGQAAPLPANETIHTMGDFTLSWSHYLVLMRIADPAARGFYEKEAAEGQWSLRQHRMHLQKTICGFGISKTKIILQQICSAA